MSLTENLLGHINRLNERDMVVENDILRKKSGVELDKALMFYLFKSWHLALQKRRVALAVKQRPYIADDLEDWKILDGINQEDFK